MLLQGGDSQDITIKRLQAQLAKMAYILIDNRLMKPPQTAKGKPSRGRSRGIRRFGGLRDPTCGACKEKQHESQFNLESQGNNKSMALSKRRVSPCRAHSSVDLREMLNAKRKQEGDLREKLDNRIATTLVKTIIPTGSVARAAISM